MARFSRRTNKKSFRKRKSRKGSRKIRRTGGEYNPLAQFQNKKKVRSREQAPKKDFLSQNMTSVTEQSNQNVAQAAKAIEEEQMRQEQLRRANEGILEQRDARLYTEAKAIERKQWEEDEARRQEEEELRRQEAYDRQQEAYERQQEMLNYSRQQPRKRMPKISMGLGSSSGLYK